LARAPAVANRYLAVTQQGVCLSQFSRPVQAHARTNPHPIDTVATLYPDSQEVAALRLVPQQERPRLRPPVDQRQIAPAIAIEVSRRSGRTINYLAVAQHFLKESPCALLGEVGGCRKVVDVPAFQGKARDSILDAETAEDHRVRLALLELDDAHGNV